MTLRLETTSKFLREMLRDSINDLKSSHASISIEDRIMELDRLRAAVHAIDGTEMPKFQTEAQFEDGFVKERSK